MTALTRMARRTFDLGVRADAAVRHLWLNTLWLGVALTVVGAPAATVAVHAVVAEWADGDERPVAARFFAAIRRHGWCATAVGGIVTVIGALLVVNFFIAIHMGEEAVAVLGVLGAVTLTTSLFAAAAPYVVAGGARGAGRILRVTIAHITSQPLSAIAAVATAAGIAFAILAFPPAALLLPAPCVRLLHALRSGKRFTLSLPRYQRERHYA